MDTTAPCVRTDSARSLRASRPEADAARMYDIQSNLLFANGLDEAKNPEDVLPQIDLTVLRKILVDAIPTDIIKEGYELAPVLELGEGEHELTLIDCATAVVDILVGADEVDSRVRPLVYLAVLVYHGAAGAEVSIAPKDTKKPELQNMVCMACAGGMGVMESCRVLTAQRNGDGHIRICLWFPGPEGWRLSSDPVETRKVLLEKFHYVRGVTRPFRDGCRATSTVPLQRESFC